MDLQTFTSDIPRRVELARRLGCSPDYLYQLGIAWRGKRPGVELAKAIERETRAMGLEAGKRWAVSRAKLRPDIWG